MSERDPRLYLHDILDAGNAIIEYTKGLSYEQFSKDRKTVSATLREFEIIGEAIGKLPEPLKKQHPEIYWQDIKDFRNLLIHEYFGVDLEIVWNILQQDLPPLIKVVTELIQSLKVQ